MGYAIGIPLGILLGAVGALLVRWLLDKRAVENVGTRAEEILRGAKHEAENIRKAAELAAKDEALKKRERVDAEVEEKRKELRDVERRLDRREEAQEKKGDQLARKEEELSGRSAELSREAESLTERGEEVDRLIEEGEEKLTTIAGLSRDEARDIVLSQAREEAEGEALKLIARRLEQAKEEVDQKAREIVVTAIQRVAADHSAESTVSVVPLPSDDMKGRIIGREGRNIRAFEKISGVDVIVDDTPGVVVVSAFDAVRRETARRAMEKLILDGRIHPSRIEDIVSETQKEMEDVIRRAGEEALTEVDLRGLHAKIVNLLGRLRFRTSYGQNVLKHVIECAHLAGAIAAELGLDVKLAKRCALLHDIGKAVNHEVEGGHVEVAADIARRLGEPWEVVNAIASHHEDVKPETPYAVITQAVDAISAARPGARRETLERYIKRMEKLEEVATSFEGVKNAYAIQAGREIRVIVNPQQVNDRTALKICREIAEAVEKQLTYPGEVKVTVLRETRVVEYAR
ncbi:MAG: ribonuclease Y [Planctomycetota bacterium]